MRYKGCPVEVVSERGVKDIVEFMLRVLDEVGMRIENKTMCRHLAEHGCEWDGEFGIRFPRRMMEKYIDEERVAKEDVPPEGRPVRFSGGAAGYPLRWVDPADLKVKTQTFRTASGMVRLSDYLPGIEGIGSVGVPQDVAPVMQPLVMRYMNWRYSGMTLANIYVIWDTRLCPYIAEFCETVSEMESAKGGMERWFRANNYLVSPLKYTHEEAEQFVWFWERGYRCTVGNLMSMGGTGPATIAGAAGLCAAELLGLSYLHRAFYGDKGFSVASKVAPLDMRSGCMPYGRPEEHLVKIVTAQVAEYLGASDAPSLGTATGAKGTDFECGMDKAFGAGMSMGLYGSVDWSFGKYSTDEVIDPRMMILESEFVESLKRLAAEVEVSEKTLPIEVVKELGPGGEYLSHPHTFEHFRDEIWMPELRSGEAYEAWVAGGSTDVLEKARRKAVEILENYHPRGISEKTEERLVGLLDGYAGELGLGEDWKPEGMRAGE
ncbi:MAG: trimethylamine methyltransferase family protein [Planctomycetes bacterium]|nr:trimethylamine methyltransferase family protein [Planctomycetota bacterium]